MRVFYSRQKGGPILKCPQTAFFFRKIHPLHELPDDDHFFKGISQ